MKLRRPPLRYYGGKFRLAPWIIGHFPEHTCYCEPFGGAMSVLLTKPPSQREVYNDADGDVVNFFRVLRDRRDELVKALRLTPFSRLEYRLAFQPCEDELERARRFYIKSWQGIGGPRRANSTGWRFEKSAKRGKSAVRDWLETDNLSAVVERLRTIQIECDDGMRVIQRFDTPATLFYVDPPYPGLVRSQRWRRKGYQHEIGDADHAALAGALRGIQGMAIVSSYPSHFYDALYEGWERFEHQSRTNSMHRGAVLKTECVYVSPRAATAARQRWLGLMGE